MNNRTLHKKENRYQLKQARQYAKHAKDNALLARLAPFHVSPVGGLRFDTTSTRLVGFLLFATAVASILPRAEGVSVVSKGGEPVGNDSSVTNHTAPAVNNVNSIQVEMIPLSSSQVEFSSGHLVNAVVGICNTSKAVGKRALFFRCSPKAQRSYEKNPAAYEQDINEIHTMFMELHQQPVVRCKLDEMMQDQRFHVALVDQADFGNSYLQAQYDGLAVSMRIPANTKKTPEDLRIVQHEIHHGFISNQNRRFKRNHYDSVKNIAGVDPFVTQQDLQKWAECLVEGCKKINLLLWLLDKQPSKLNLKQRELLATFKRAAANYEPYIHNDLFRSQIILDRWLQEGYLDKNYQVKSPGFLSPIEYALTTSTDSVVPPAVAKKYVFFNKKTELGHIFQSRSVVDASDRVRAALLDGVIKIKEVLSGQLPGGGNIYTEADAYIHELYEPYPDLFNLLFSKLQKYHLDRSKDEYKACLRL